MSIVRVNKEGKYFAASNEPFNDERLRWDTRGMIGYLLSKPNNWTIRMADLIKKGPGGRDKVRMMLRDAQKHGYLNRYRITRLDGTFLWVWELYETPTMNKEPQTSGGFSVTGSEPVTGLPLVEKPVTGLPVDIVSTDKANTESATTRDAPANIYTIYEQEIGALTPIIADALKDAEDTYAADWIEDALRVAAENNKRNWKYAEAILKRWKAQGFKDSGKKPAGKKGSSRKPEPFKPYEPTEEELEKQRKEFAK